VTTTSGILLGGNQQHQQVIINTAMSNRHGIISGATGSGKTVSLQVLAEQFSQLGVPVFISDAKGDLSGLANPAAKIERFQGRLNTIGINDYSPSASPTLFWDIFGKNGHPVRTTISEMGPLLISHLLELNDTQTGIIYSCFKIADDNGMLLLDLKDLRSMLIWMSKNAKQLRSEYGNISSSSVGAIQRHLLVLEEQGAEHFFAEPAVTLADFMQVDFSGRGVISILDSVDLIAKSPRLYSTFLLWLLSELYENLPEKGDAEKPELVLFFDEAHLLFDQAPKVLLNKVEQIVRLIRSKGVGVYFITQTPLDIPDDILGQLGLRIQHVLRVFTPKDRKTVKAVAENFRSNPNIDVATAITELEIGEALVSVLDAKGAPTPVERILIRPPASQIGPLQQDQRLQRIQRSPLAGRYDQVLDRESAYELLKARAEEKARQAELNPKRKPGRPRQSVGEAFIKSAARSIGSQIGRQVIRGVLGAIFGGRR
jgi:DNA helicase HerA-like ATPase